MTSAPNQPTDLQRFDALAKRILTTPKAELTKHVPKKTTKVKRKKKHG